MSELGAPILAWVEDVIGPHARVRSVREMPPWSCEMHELVVHDGAETEHHLVLRRYADERRLAADAFYDPANEARALSLLEETDVPAPRLYAG